MRISLILAVAAFVIMVKCHDRSDDADYEKPRRHHRHRHSRRTHGSKHILQDPHVLDLLSEYSTLKKQLQRLERHLERNTLLNKKDWNSENSAQDYNFGDVRDEQQDNIEKRHSTTVVEPTTTTETATTTQTTTEATTTSAVSNTPTPTTRITTQTPDEEFTIPMKTTLRIHPTADGEEDYSDLTLDTEKLELEQGSSTDEPVFAAENQTTDNRRENSEEPSQMRESTEKKRKITWTYEPLSEPKMVGFPTVQEVGKVEDEVKPPAESEKRLNREVHSLTEPGVENTKVSPDEDTVSMSEPLPTKEGFVPVVMGPDGPIVLPHYVINSKSAEDELGLNLNPTLATSSIKPPTRRFKIEPPQAPPTAPRHEPTYRRLTEAEFLERRRKEYQERKRLEKEGTKRQRETSKSNEFNGNSEEHIERKTEAKRRDSENTQSEIRNRQKMSSSSETDLTGGRDEYVDYRPSGQKAIQPPNYQTFSNDRLAQMLHEFPELSSILGGGPWAGYNREAPGAQFDMGGPGFQGVRGFMGGPGYGYNQGFPSGYAPRLQGRRAIAPGQLGNGMVAVPPSSIDFEGIFDKKQ